MFSDFHCHCLPGIDDGSPDVETSFQMLSLLKMQGVDKVAATPHYACSVESIDDFIGKRDDSFARLKQHYDLSELPDIRPGAEVVLERDLIDIDLRRLCITGTNCLLLEFPYGRHKSWMPELIENISYKYSITPVLAHFERYLQWYEKKDYLLHFNNKRVIIQNNISVFGSHSGYKFLKSVIKSGSRYTFGSDAHNMTSRAPNFVFPERFLKKHGESEKYICDIDNINDSDDAVHLLI